MIAYQPMEIVITPSISYVILTYMSEFRRIFTDGRKWSAEIEAAYAGYSVGTWEDSAKSGRYDTLVIETRGMKGSRTFDSSGLPLHKDNETIVRERISLDKANPNLLHNEVTTIDNALTRPWTVKRSYRRERNAEWSEMVCSEDNRYVIIGQETYERDNDGNLKPTRRAQPAPSLQYFPNRR